MSITPKSFLLFLCNCFLSLLPSVPGQPPICILSLKVSLQFLEFYINGIMCILFCLTSRIQHNSLQIHPGLVACINGFFFLLLSSTPQYGNTIICLSIQLLMDIWGISSFWLLQIKLLCTCMYKYLNGHIPSFLYSKFQE